MQNIIALTTTIRVGSPLPVLMFLMREKTKNQQCKKQTPKKGKRHICPILALRGVLTVSRRSRTENTLVCFHPPPFLLSYSLVLLFCPSRDVCAPKATRGPFRRVAQAARAAAAAVVVQAAAVAATTTTLGSQTLIAVVQNGDLVPTAVATTVVPARSHLHPQRRPPVNSVAGSPDMYAGAAPTTSRTHRLEGTTEARKDSIAGGRGPPLYLSHACSSSLSHRSSPRRA